MVLKRNLPSSFSTRLNPWEEATKPAPQQPEAALRWGQDDEARRPTQAARQPGQGQTMQGHLPQSLIGGGEPAQTRPQREPRNLLEAVQAAGRRRGVLPPEPEQEFDFPAIKRATGTLTSIFGRPPREGDIIPAGSVDRYLKSLSADQFDKREDIEFFNHVRDAYRLAYPTTSYDISGRMSDSPPVAIPFKPWGEAKPRSPQGMGAGTGMPGILKASAPAEEEDKPEEPKPRPDEKPEPKDPQPPQQPENDPKEEEKEAENRVSAEQCQLWQVTADRYKQEAAELSAEYNELRTGADNLDMLADSDLVNKGDTDAAGVAIDLILMRYPAARIPYRLKKFVDRLIAVKETLEKAGQAVELSELSVLRSQWKADARDLRAQAEDVWLKKEQKLEDLDHLKSYARPRDCEIL